MKPLVTVSIILLAFGVQFDHSINAHDGNTSLNSTLELLELTHARLQNTSLEAVVNTALCQVEAVVAVLLLLSNGLLFLVGLSFLDTLGYGVSLAELSNELGRVFCCVDG